ncbi:hypothetical protein NXW27_00495 [Phocaeicola dorei]|nr:hypothetical protein [Phocaeicola dorei]
MRIPVVSSEPQYLRTPAIQERRTYFRRFQQELVTGTLEVRLKRCHALTSGGYLIDYDAVGG